MMRRTAAPPAHTVDRSGHERTILVDADALDACPICADRHPPERHQLREMLFGTRERFDYLRCPNCGALRIANVPDDLGRHYPSAYYDGDVGDVLAPLPRPRSPLARVAGQSRDRALLLRRGRRLARGLERWAPPVSNEVRRASAFSRRAGLRSFDDPILDVGCGRRALNLANLRKVGFRDLLGIDPFLDSDTEFAGIPLRRRSVDEQEGFFQAVMFHHSFEHVPDPEATLRAAAGLLRDRGVILVRTPAMGTWFWEQYGSDWWELDAPRHLWIHTPASLEILGRRAGLALADVVWDSTYLEVIASEQIARDIAWREPGSWFVDRPDSVDPETIERYRATTDELNRTGRAGRAGFYFRRSSAAEHAQPGPAGGEGPGAPTEVAA
jgi:SAM-dependent methyltransferase